MVSNRQHGCSISISWEKQFCVVITIALLLEDTEHLTHKLAHFTAFKQKILLKILVCIWKVKQKSINSNN